MNRRDRIILGVVWSCSALALVGLGLGLWWLYKFLTTPIRLDLM